MISPNVKWNHRSNWWVTSYEMENDLGLGVKSIKVGVDNAGFDYMLGHVIDGNLHIFIHLRSALVKHFIKIKLLLGDSFSSLAGSTLSIFTF